MFVLAGCVAAAVLVWGCKQTALPPAQAPAPQTEAAPEGQPPPAEEPAAEGEAEAPQEGAKGEAEAAPTPTTPPEPALDREQLSACYQEVYCAQKKGEMEKILDIYKAHGFETPQDFTKAWIEAAKDTDWITRVANSVAKKCQ
jgi:hypothetical protein